MIGSADTAAVAEICVGLEGLPLAIEMAAARASVLSPAQIADRLAEGTVFLAGGEVDRAPRQRTIEAAIEWSYHLLSPTERNVFNRLAVFAGSFDIDAATGVIAATMRSGDLGDPPPTLEFELSHPAFADRGRGGCGGQSCQARRDQGGCQADPILRDLPR